MDYIEVKINIKKDVYQIIENIVTYKNFKDSFFDDIDTNVTVEGFIEGCVNYYLKQIQGNLNISGIDEMNRGQLKNKIDELLQQKKLSQKDLSILTGISPSNINNYIKNRNQPTLDHFFKIWFALECPPLSWILCRIPTLEK